MCIRDRYSITREMGRYLVAECGVYVTGIADIKKNKGQQYVIVDGGINHVNYYGQAMACLLYTSSIQINMLRLVFR